MFTGNNMSTPSIRSSTYGCSHPFINDQHAARLQSARTFDSNLNVASHVHRDANDPYSGRPSVQNAANGVSGLEDLGMSGLNPSNFIALENSLRQVGPVGAETAFYDTMTGANRSGYNAEFAGKSGTMCGVAGGSDSYTSVPMNSNDGRMMQQSMMQQVGSTSVDRKNYMAALKRESDNMRGMY